MKSLRKYVISIDQGTTSSRALLVNHDLKIEDKAQRDLPNITSQPGWVE
jgi:glycerol kinase